MCGRVTLTTTAERLAAEYALSDWPERVPRYNIAPTQLIDVLRTRPDGTREIAALRWGFIPEWSLAPYQLIINARCETVNKKPAFRNAFQLRRCLIPVDGFFEWKQIGKARQPFLIRMRDRKPCVLAGLWERCESDPAGPLETCVVLTTDPNPLVAPLKDRMPVIIGREHMDLWLDRGTVDYEKLKPLFQPYPAEKMEAIPVNRRVNDAKNNDPECVAPVVLAPQIIQGELDFG